MTSHPNGTTSTGTETSCAEVLYDFRFVRDNRHALAGRGDNFFAKQRSPVPLNQVSVPGKISSAPSIVRSIRLCSAKVRHGDVEREACALLRSEVAMPTISRPSFATRRPKASMAYFAVEPVPRPTTMPDLRPARGGFAASFFH